jgi:LuxR family maltose regulon positive regulatory protein
MEQPSPSRGVVSDQMLVYEREAQEISIPVGTPAWYAWLEQAHAFSFQDGEGTFTAHKARPSNRRGGWYWYAYRRQHGQLFRSYLGASSSLTFERLGDAARQLSLKAEISSHKPQVSAGSLALLPPRLEDSHQTTFLTTKFHIPRLPVHHITRSRLLTELDQGTQTRLTLVSAPAGSGKTTLLSTWARSTNLPVTWLSLEAADDDPQRFLSAFITALKHLDTQIGEQDVALHRIIQEHSWQEVLTHFVNNLGALLTRDTVVILDDYHLISNEAIHTALRFFIEHAPPQLHLLIGTRNDPPLPLARLRAQGQLCELHTEALCFISDEVEAFVRAMGLTLSGEATSLLEQRTEGWIAGIQLLTLALRGRPDATAFLHASGGTHHFLLDYVSEEILAQQTPEMQHFLLRTCILERFTGSLCDAVTGECGGQAKLSALLRANLFVSALDDTQTWYRYHPLFAETLHAHLQKLEPDLIPELYRLASHWYEQHQGGEEACDYALLAGDFPRAAHLVAELLPQMVEQGHFEQLGRWLGQLPPALIAASPQLYITTPWMYSLNKRLPVDVDQILKHMEQHVQKHKKGEKASWVEPQSVLTLFHALTALSQNNLPRAFMLVRKALRILTTRETALSQLIARFLKISLSILYGSSGDLTTAEQILLELSKIQPKEEISLINLAAPFLLGELYKAQGQLHKGEALYGSFVQAFGSPRDIPPMPLLVIGFSMMRRTSLLYEWNRLPEAASGIQQVLEMLPRAVMEIIPRASQPALLAFGLWAQARVEWAQGRPDAARYFLEVVRNQPEMMGELPPQKERPPVDVATLAVRLALVCDQVEETLSWEHTCGIRFDDAPVTLLESRQVFVYLTLARVLIGRGRKQGEEEALSQALILLKHWHNLADRLDLQGWLIEVQMLTSLALQAQGKTRQALTTLGAVLTQAELEGYVRLFADEGQPMRYLLTHISAYTAASPSYIQRLQAAMPPTHQALLSPTQSKTSLGTLDPLSRREQEVLSLLAAGASNQMLADRLVISLNTAKRHVKNIIAKLNVSNRTQAVARARELHLL